MTEDQKFIANLAAKLYASGEGVLMDRQYKMELIKNSIHDAIEIASETILIMNEFESKYEKIKKSKEDK